MPPDAGARAAFDRLSRLATRLLSAQCAWITLAGDDPAPSMTPLVSTLTHAIIANGCPAIVPDARLDNPLADAVALLGVPLTTAPGLVAGAFCAVDSAPRRWTDDDLATLRDLADTAQREVDAWETRAELARLREEHEQ